MERALPKDLTVWRGWMMGEERPHLEVQSFLCNTRMAEAAPSREIRPIQACLLVGQIQLRQMVGQMERLTMAGWMLPLLV